MDEESRDPILTTALFVPWNSLAEILVMELPRAAGQITRSLVQAASAFDLEMMVVVAM